MSVQNTKSVYPIYKEIAGECLRFPYVQFYYIKGHADNNGNERAHELANSASKYYRDHNH